MGSVLVGRDDELRRVAAALGSGGGEQAAALIVEGDAGVGKTSLVQEACTRLGPETLVLRGACLPLTSMTVPFLPLRSAFRDVADFDGPPTRVPLAIEARLREVSETRPVILSIDDLQWADQGTLDVLLYLIAGPAERHVSIVVTIRSGDAAVGRPIDRWLAEVRRMPRVEFLTLGPLDRVATALLIEDVMGTSPDQSLVEDVFSHSRGHPYLTELAVVGLAPGAPHLPRDLPTSLTSAVVESVRDLDPPVRELLGILAVGGTPARASTLAAVMVASGVSIRSSTEADDLDVLLAAAVGAGAIVSLGDGSYWFRHPLTAEVLEQELTTTARATWHAAFARHDSDSDQDGATSGEVLVRIADHFHVSGKVDEAYLWSLRAADSAGDAGAHREEFRLLTRAVQLHPSVSAPPELLIDLLQRQRRSAADAGALMDELGLVERLLQMEEPDSLARAVLLARQMNLRAATQIERRSPEGMVDAVRLSATDPASWQHALALALWCGAHGTADEVARVAPDALKALEIAQETGHPLALAWALLAVGTSDLFAGRFETAAARARETIEPASDAMDYLAFNHAVELETWATETWWSRAHAENIRRRRGQLSGIGAPHTFVAWLAIHEANAWLSIGEWRECLRCLRFTIGFDPGPIVDVGARITAARLAALQGRQDEAVAHLTRARELLGERRLALSFGFDAVHAEVLLAQGDAVAAFDAAMEGIEKRDEPLMGQWLVPLAARALADQAETSRDAGTDVAPVLVKLEGLLGSYPDVLREPDLPETDLVLFRHVAFSSLYASEVSRARRDPDAGESWLRTADTCADATLPWEEAYACLRAAEALLLRGRGAGPGAAGVVRRGLQLGAELDAQPIVARLTELATMAHVRLDDLDAVEGELAFAELEGLTAREREILRYVVAGRTYAEIAADLTISEKTVSSHISSLLRKTGATNRIHLAKIAAASRVAD